MDLLFKNLNCRKRRPKSTQPPNPTTPKIHSGYTPLLKSFHTSGLPHGASSYVHCVVWHFMCCFSSSDFFIRRPQIIQIKRWQFPPVVFQVLASKGQSKRVKSPATAELLFH